MAEAFNPYREWLGLDAPPSSYYQLLGLPPGESDSARISLAAEQAARKVRSFRPGPNAVAWSRLLDEIQEAKQCLLDPQQRAEYDRSQLADRSSRSLPANKPSTALANPPRQIKPDVNAEMYPPGMDAPGSGQPQRQADPSPAPLVPQPQDALLPPVSLPSEELAPAGLPMAYLAPGDGTATQNTAAPGQAGYSYGGPAPFPYDPYAGPGDAALPASAGGAYPAAPDAAIDPMAPVSVPAVAAPQAPYAAPYYGPPEATYAAVAGGMPAYALPPNDTSQQPGGYMSSPMPLGGPIPQGSPPIVPEATADVALPAATSRSVSTRARRNEARALRNLLMGGISVVLLLAASALVYVTFTRGERPQLVQTPSGPPSPPAGRPEENLRPIERSVESKLVRPRPVLPETTESPANTGLDPVDDVRPPSVPETGHSMPEPTPDPAGPSVTTAPDTGPDPSPFPAPVTDPGAAPVPEPTPLPTPEPEPLPMVSRAEVTALARSLTNAKVALGEMNFAEADAALTKAATLARLPEHRLMVSRLKEVGQYVKQFRQALVDAAAGLDGADVFTVGNSTQVAFVEGSNERVVLRIAGMNRVYPYHDMPAGLAVALADLKLDGGDPVNRVVKGAYLLVHKRPPDDARAKAKTWWEEAQLGGVDIEHLMPFLNDNYDDLAKDLPQ